MGYYDTEKGVNEYVEMAEGYDGRALVEVLKKHLSRDAAVLELGMGPGKDLEILGESFSVTGSDSSQVFLEKYRAKDPDADLVLLDAVTMDVDRQFDGIYSNKVLQHLTREDFATSLRRQAKALHSGGILLHSLWYGDKEEVFSGVRFVHYTEESFARAVGSEYEIVEVGQYAEMEENDSIYFVLKKKG